MLRGGVARSYRAAECDLQDAFAGSLIRHGDIRLESGLWLRDGERMTGWRARIHLFFAFFLRRVRLAQYLWDKGETSLLCA